MHAPELEESQSQSFDEIPDLGLYSIYLVAEYFCKQAFAHSSTEFTVVVNPPRSEAEQTLFAATLVIKIGFAEPWFVGVTVGGFVGVSVGDLVYFSGVKIQTFQEKFLHCSETLTFHNFVKFEVRQFRITF